jgi:lipopolysaccharide transport system permease protein
MAWFSGVGAVVEGSAIQVRFDLDSPGVIGWQIYDPLTGVFLFEGEWVETRDTHVEMRLPLPGEDGPYRVQVAPVADRERFILIDARVSSGKVEIALPRVTTAATLRRKRLLCAIPKAFLYPPRTVWINRKLIGSMVRRDIMARYRGSFGGAIWTFLNPLLLMTTYFFVFGIVLKARFENDPSSSGFVLYFLAGMLPWLAFAEAVGRSPYVMMEYRNFVKKLVFPLETLPVNLVISGAATEAFALVIFLCGLLLARGAVPGSVLWLPALVIPQLLLTAGLCWFLAALGVFLRDLGQIMGFLLTLWFFLTPICYPETQLPSGAAKILSLNPIFALVRGYRAIFLENHPPDFTALIALWIGSAALAICGHAWFYRLRKSFADVI